MPARTRAHAPSGRAAAAAVALLLAAGAPDARCLHFDGLPLVTANRVDIALDAPPRPVDVGGDFTLELWVRIPPGSNPAGDPCTAANDRWIYGNILIDRDVFGPGDVGDYGVSLMAGRVAFGVSRGSSGATACGARDLRDGQWHHLALTRDVASGALRIWVDGSPDVAPAVGPVSGPTGDIAYRDGRPTSWPASDPLLVLGTEKHFGDPPWAGTLDDLRISNRVRYTSAFVPPTAPHALDADTVALYRFDEGSGSAVGDLAAVPGGPSPGLIRSGGMPASPSWSTDCRFGGLPFADGFEAGS